MSEEQVQNASSQEQDYFILSTVLRGRYVAHYDENATVWRIMITDDCADAEKIAIMTRQMYYERYTEAVQAIHALEKRNSAYVQSILKR